MMIEPASIAAQQKLFGQYTDNQTSMEDYLAGLRALKAQYLKGRNNATLPVVP